MGNESSSTITNEIENKQINESTIRQINNNVSQVMTNNVISSQSKAYGDVTQIGDIQINCMTSSGKGSVIKNVNIGIDQKQNIVLKSSDESIQTSNLQANYAMTLLTNIQNGLSSQQQAQLASEAKAKQENGFLSTAIANSVQAEVNNKIKNIQENRALTEIFNSISNSITQNTSTMNFKDCIMRNLQTAAIKVGCMTASDGGTLDGINININQVVDVVQNCIFKTLQDSNIGTVIAQNLGFTVKNDLQAKQEAASDAKASSDQQNKGVDSLMGSSLYSMIALIVICVIGIVIIAVVLNLRGKQAINKVPNMNPSEFMGALSSMQNIKGK